MIEKERPSVAIYELIYLWKGQEPLFSYSHDSPDQQDYILVWEYGCKESLLC